MSDETKHPLDGLLESAARKYDAQTSIAISLKRIADALTADLIELPLRNGGTAHIRSSQVASISIDGRYQDMTFIQMIGDTGETGFTVSASIGEVTKRLHP